jgi:hypothetical protein
VVLPQTIYTDINAAPVTFADDVKAASTSAHIYFLQGSGTTAFYRYDFVGNSWSAALAVAPNTIGAGGGLVYPGTGDFIYGFRGGGNLGFYRYSISGNVWNDPLVADLPALDRDMFPMVPIFITSLERGIRSYLNILLEQIHGQRLQIFPFLRITEQTWNIIMANSILLQVI